MCITERSTHRDGVYVNPVELSTYGVDFTIKRYLSRYSARTVYSRMTFTVSARRSEHYPIRQWHMVRNKAFVLRDLKIRIVFPLNQWAVCFTAMNNALPVQNLLPSLPSLLTLPSRTVFVVPGLPSVQCLKCFRTFALHNKVEILIPLCKCFIFT